MKRVIAIGLTLSTCSAIANDVCSIKPISAEKVVKIHGVPGYFFKVHPDGDYVTFIGAQSNALLDLNSGVEKPLVGTIDPVWSPDGKFMTHPGHYNEQGQATGIQFFEGHKIIADTVNGVPQNTQAINSPLQGVYQSIGKSGDKYTMISDQDGISMTRFNYGASGPSNFETVRRPCGNVPNMPSDLPMISKDGRFMSVFDQTTKSTKIFKVNGDSCNLALDLGYGTGKVSFNADSSQIAFHVDQFSEFENGYFSGVGKDKVKNVVVLNLDETTDGKLKPTSWAMASRHTKPGDGGYYPDFDKNGNIYFMEDSSNNFQFVKVNQRNLEFRPMSHDLVFGNVNCAPEESPSALAVLANMWKDVCGKEKPTTPELIMGIDPAACQEMVNRFFVASLKVSKAQLLNSCPQNPQSNPHEVGEWDVNQSAKAEEMLQGKCLNCHKTPKSEEVTEKLRVYTGPSEMSEEDYTYVKRVPPMTMANMDYSVATEMLEAIASGKMPKKEPLTEDQKTLLINYLQKRQLDMKPHHIGDYLEVRRFSERHLEVERQKAFASFPSATPEQKQEMVHMVNCVYGQKNCAEYLASQQRYAELEAKNLPEEQRQGFITNRLTGIRCQNLYEVTPSQCKQWERKQPRQAQ